MAFAININRLRDMLAGLAQRLRWSRLVHLAGWGAFIAVLVWFYRIPPWMWATHMPPPPDPLEALWQIEFWRHAVLTADFDLVSVTAMYPLGLHQMTIAHSGTGLLLLPIALLVGSATALNVGFVGGQILCFVGARYFLKQLVASTSLTYIGAIVFTFALGRTVHTRIHLNMLLGSALSVWMAALLLRLGRQEHAHRARGLAIASGVLWGMAILAQAYALFHNLPLFVLLGRRWRAWKYLPLIGATALVVSGPFLYALFQGSAYMSFIGPSLASIVYFQSAPASFVGWGPFSNWRLLADWTAAWRQVLAEQHAQNWGVVAPALAVIGGIISWRAKWARSLVILLLVSAVLAFGPLWESPPLVGRGAFASINESIWQVGRQLKPRLFSPRSESLKADTMPLPSMALLVFVPRYEFARVPGRYAIWFGLAVVALTVAALGRLPGRWGVAIGCLWLLELLPLPQAAHPVPTRPHPAHAWAAEWLRAQPRTDLGVYSPPGIISTYSHYLSGDLPGAITFGSFVAAHLRYTRPWITFAHIPVDPPVEALADPSNAAILRRAQIGLVLLRPKAAALAKQNTALRFVRCFDPGPEVETYYPYPLCAFEVLPRDDDFFNIQPVNGFGEFNANSTRVVETHAGTGWRTTWPAPHIVELILHPRCPLDSQLSVQVYLNGRLLGAHTWPSADSCGEPWVASLGVNAAQLKSGWNALELRVVLGSSDEANLIQPPYLEVKRLRVSRQDDLPGLER